MTLRASGVSHGHKITFKDLGPQISWRTVFLIEYFGPLLFHSLCYFAPAVVYQQRFEHSYVQRVAYFCVMGHYIKRELESVFVHRFSLATMPIFNLFKNCAHYWIFGGLMTAYFLYHPAYRAPFSDQTTTVLAFVFVLMELGNLQAHLTLRNLRAAGTTDRAIPHGGLFEWVSCANYTFEILAWLVFSIATNTLTGWLFLLLSTGQMLSWAMKKHGQYVKEFGSRYTTLRRAVLVPFIF